eukprot:6120337-Pyramimonas_sp.AAC.1
MLASCFSLRLQARPPFSVQRLNSSATLPGLARSETHSAPRIIRDSLAEPRPQLRHLLENAKCMSGKVSGVKFIFGCGPRGAEWHLTRRFQGSRKITGCHRSLTGTSDFHFP